MSTLAGFGFAQPLTFLTVVAQFAVSTTQASHNCVLLIGIIACLGSRISDRHKHSHSSLDSSSRWKRRNGCCQRYHQFESQRLARSKHSPRYHSPWLESPTFGTCYRSSYRRHRTHCCHRAWSDSRHHSSDPRCRFQRRSSNFFRRHEDCVDFHYRGDCCRPAFHSPAQAKQAPA